jgi:hypothetical protein
MKCNHPGLRGIKCADNCCVICSHAHVCEVKCCFIDPKVIVPNCAYLESSISDPKRMKSHLNFANAH